MEVEVEVHKEVEELGKMTLLDRIALLDRPHWTPPVCAKCGKQQLNHCYVRVERSARLELAGYDQVS